TPAIVAEAEASFDFTILDEAVKNASYTDCSELELDLEGSDAVELVSQALPGQVVLDIRAPDEQELSPLQVADVEVVHIPFYALNSRFGELDSSRAYLLYCDKGIMSQLHAQYLLDAGHDNVRVLRLPKV